MAIFVVFRVAEPAKMRSAIQSRFTEDHFDLGHDEWLISAKGTAKDIADTLGVTTEGFLTGSAMVFRMDSYFGRTSMDVWDWIKSKVESTDG